MIQSITKLLRVEVVIDIYIDNPNSKKQRIFDEVAMIELITRLLEVIHKRDFEEG